MLTQASQLFLAWLNADLVYLLSFSYLATRKCLFTVRRVQWCRLINKCWLVRVWIVVRFRSDEDWCGWKNSREFAKSKIRSVKMDCQRLLTNRIWRWRRKIKINVWQSLVQTVMCHYRYNNGFIEENCSEVPLLVDSKKWNETPWICTASISCGSWAL